MEFHPQRQPMVRTSAEAEARTYRVYHGRRGRRWLVAEVENAAGYIYVEDPSPNSRGFGGRTLTFPLVDGGSLSLRGPRQTNAGALYAATGVDVRDRHFIYGCVSLGIRYEPGFIMPVLTDVIHLDERPVLGTFNRIRDKAQEEANRRGVVVYCYSQSEGGASFGPIQPEGATSGKS